MTNFILFYLSCITLVKLTVMRDLLTYQVPNRDTRYLKFNIIRNKTIPHNATNASLILTKLWTIFTLYTKNCATVRKYFIFT